MKILIKSIIYRIINIVLFTSLFELALDELDKAFIVAILIELTKFLIYICYEHIFVIFWNKNQ